MNSDFHLTPYRSHDVSAVLDRLATGQSVSVVGLSNLGKSMLLRQMVEPEVARRYEALTGRAVMLVYVDCNRMLEMSAQGLYEVILRAALEALDRAPVPRVALKHAVAAHYQTVIESPGTFAVPLAFNDAIIALLRDQPEQDVVLLLDEFDAVLTGLDERVFLNLRALKDKYVERLSYVTATLKPPSAVGGGDDLAEFFELFAAYKHYLVPLSPDKATELAVEVFEQANDHLDPPERDYILEQAGGHPGLIQAVAYVVMEVESGAPPNYTEKALSMAGDVLENHRLVRNELGKLWKHLLPSERDAVTRFVASGASALSEAERRELLLRGLLVEDAGGLRLFARLFENYARRQGLVQQSVPDGVWVDIDAGTVWVHGREIESLTELEYRLLLLLYGRLDKICDKAQIVEAVWGQDYLGDVDDARIEKLVSRLRSKLEIDPSNPRFISTVRGRGYRLNRANTEAAGVTSL